MDALVQKRPQTCKHWVAVILIYSIFTFLVIKNTCRQCKIISNIVNFDESVKFDTII